MRPKSPGATCVPCFCDCQNKYKNIYIYIYIYIYMLYIGMNTHDNKNLILQDQNKSLCFVFEQTATNVQEDLI